MIVPHGTDEEELKKVTMAHEKIAPLLLGKTVVKVIVVVDRLVNLVVK
jgi:leucyl-tRNA synthetase